MTVKVTRNAAGREIWLIQPEGRRERELEDVCLNQNPTGSLRTKLALQLSWLCKCSLHFNAVLPLTDIIVSTATYLILGA